MINVIEFKVYFTYVIENLYKWCDDFEINEEWQILRLNKIKHVEKVYMERSPYLKTRKNYEIALYTKNKWIYLENGQGEMTSFTEDINIPNLKIVNKIIKPNVTLYKLNFNLQVMLTIIGLNNEVIITETKTPAIKKALLIYNKLYIELYDDIFVFKGSNINEFEKFCKRFETEYKNKSKDIEELFNKVDVYKKDLYRSLAYKTWFRASRINQKEWPYITNVKIENGLEFPKDSGIWYYHDKYKVALSKRHDDNNEIYIPKLYKTIKENNVYKIPYSIKTNGYKNAAYIREWKGEPCTIIDFKGNIIETDLHPLYIVYDNIIIENTEEKYETEGIVQILNKNNKVEAIIDENDNIIQYNGYRIRNKLCVPWYYKQIIHDYNKLGRLKEGNYTDLMDIGIVSAADNDIITWKNIKNLYVSKCLETNRLVTFKYKPNISINICDNKYINNND